MLSHFGEWQTHVLRLKSSCPHQDQNKRHCLEFLLHFKEWSFGARGSKLSGQPGSLAYSQLLTGFRLPLGDCVWGQCGHGHVTARSLARGEDRPVHCPKQGTRSKRDSLFPWGYIRFGCGRGQILSQKDQLTSYTFCALGESTTQPIPSQAALVLHLPYHHSDF